MRSWLKYIFLLIGTLLALYIGADMNYFFRPPSLSTARSNTARLYSPLL